ncbi:NifB/NifX family molybdenum-iron cluster-binding protein [Candidatus Parcubacteria bacterium]|nr:NifB/NifX family molybdenum-iron cluster-binding protein [Candidatus Parcubacteria bacterium]
MNQENKVIKICAATSDKGINAEIDSRFGRCGHFTLFTIQNKEILNTEVVQNSGASQSGGAGISAAEQVGKLGADILIAQNIGPKAAGVLEKLDIKIVKKSGIVKSVVEEYIKNYL